MVVLSIITAAILTVADHCLFAFQACRQLQQQQQPGRRVKLKTASRKAIKVHSTDSSLHAAAHSDT